MSLKGGCPANIGWDNIKQSFVPHDTGVYIFKDEDNNILYVGRACCMGCRVKSHFWSHTQKDCLMLSKVTTIDWIALQSDQLSISERLLIGVLTPQFNRTKSMYFNIPFLPDSAPQSVKDYITNNRSVVS